MHTNSQVGDFTGLVKYVCVYELDYSNLSHHFQEKHTAFTGND